MRLKNILSYGFTIFFVGYSAFFVTDYVIKILTSKPIEKSLSQNQNTQSNKVIIENSEALISKKEKLKKMWVLIDRVPRRTCPSNRCGVVGQGFFREGMPVHESKNGWLRITKYYDASCKDGNSEYVDSGQSSCVAHNGIIEGQFAEWVESKFLGEIRPQDPAIDAYNNEKLVAKSDDYKKYKSIFLSTTLNLISKKRCSEKDFLEQGGWIKSSNHGDGIYFIWCSDYSDRVYLNTKTGKTN